jgi:hypothetical protein
VNGQAKSWEKAPTALPIATTRSITVPGAFAAESARRRHRTTDLTQSKGNSRNVGRLTPIQDRAEGKETMGEVVQAI